MLIRIEKSIAVIPYSVLQEEKHRVEKKFISTNNYFLQENIFPSQSIH